MKSKKDGFTLVELIIVIAIIAILAAILVPSFSSVITSARKSADIQQMKQINLMLRSGDIDKTYLPGYVLQTDGWELAYSEVNNDVVIVKLAKEVKLDVIVEAETDNLVGQKADDNGYIRVSALKFTNPPNPDLDAPNGEQPPTPEHQHKMETIESKEPTCTEVGHKEHYKCSSCGGIFRDEEGKSEVSEDEITIAAKGHAMEPIESKEPTCTEDGNEEYYRCSSCGEIFRDEEGTSEVSEDEITIAAKGHVMKTIELKAATCTEDGNEEYYKCSVCGGIFRDEEGKSEVSEDEITIVAKGHSYSTDWNNDDEYHWYDATCGHNDVKDKDMHTIENGECVVCGYKQKSEPSQSEWDFIIENDEDLKTKAGDIKDKTQAFTVYLKDNVTELKDYFKENKFLTRIILGKGIEVIPDNAFDKCESLEEVIMEGAVSEIKNNAFRYCSKLEKIELPFGLTTIGERAFKKCEALKYLVLPQSVKQIEVSTFEQCHFIELSLPCVIIEAKGGIIDTENFNITVEKLTIGGGTMQEEEGTTNGFTSWLAELIEKSLSQKTLSSLTIRNTTIGNADPFGSVLKDKQIRISIDKESYDSIMSNELKQFFMEYISDGDQN